MVWLLICQTIGLIILKRFPAPVACLFLSGSSASSSCPFIPICIPFMTQSFWNTIASVRKHHIVMSFGMATDMGEQQSYATSVKSIEYTA